MRLILGLTAAAFLLGSAGSALAKRGDRGDKRGDRYDDDYGYTADDTLPGYADDSHAHYHDGASCSLDHNVNNDSRYDRGYSTGYVDTPRYDATPIYTDGTYGYDVSRSDGYGAFWPEVRRMKRRFQRRLERRRSRHFATWGHHGMKRAKRAWKRTAREMRRNFRQRVRAKYVSWQRQQHHYGTSHHYGANHYYEYRHGNPARRGGGRVSWR